jgi:hypothetical protein
VRLYSCDDGLFIPWSDLGALAVEPVTTITTKRNLLIVQAMR